MPGARSAGREGEYGDRAVRVQARGVPRGRRLSDVRRLDPELESFLEGPGRRSIPGAAPVVSWREDDDPAWGEALIAAGARPIRLERRGRDHGRVALLPRSLAQPPAKRREDRGRWERARPVFLPRSLAGALPLWRPEIFRSTADGQHLQTAPGALRARLEERLGGKRSRFAVEPDPREPADAERDIEVVGVADRSGAGRDLWVKSGRLSTHPLDRSLRVRFGFGREGADDDSRHGPSHRALAALLGEVVPEAELIEGAREVWTHLAGVAGERLYATGAIQYWNLPQGGALWHHDAFSADDRAGQRGVLFAQLAGATFWLALSIAELAGRLAEFGALLATGEMPWLEERTGPEALVALAELGRRPAELITELALPGQGRLGPLTECGPEFTLFLVDCGHGLVLEAGDVLVLPNGGLAKTCMHSVFCASPGPTYALSLGLRAADPPRRRRPG